MLARTRPQNGGPRAPPPASLRESRVVMFVGAREAKWNKVPFRFHGSPLGEATQQFQPVIRVTDCSNSDKRIDDVFHGRTLRM